MPDKDSIKVRWSEAGEEYWARAGVISNEPDFTVVFVKPRFYKGGLTVAWSTVSAGFGELNIYTDKDGQLCAATEGMDKDFCKAVLAKLIDSLKVDDV